MLAQLFLTIVSLGCFYDTAPDHICDDLNNLLLSVSSCNESFICISPILTQVINSMEPYKDPNLKQTQVSGVKVNISEVAITGLDGINIELEEEGGMVKAQSIAVRGVYQVDGYVFNFIPIYGNGPFVIE